MIPKNFSFSDIGNSGKTVLTVVVVASLSFLFAFTWLESRLCQESSAMAAYSRRLTDVSSRITPGMSKQEVIDLVGSPPDNVRIVEHSQVLEWSTAYRQYPIARYFYPETVGADYFLSIALDDRELVINNLSGSGR